MFVLYEARSQAQTTRDHRSTRRRKHPCKTCCYVSLVVSGVLIIVGGVIPIASGDTYVLAICLFAAGVVAIAVGFYKIGFCTLFGKPTYSNGPPDWYQTDPFQQHQPSTADQHLALSATFQTGAQPPQTGNAGHGDLQPTAPSWQDQSHERQLRSPPFNPDYMQSSELQTSDDPPPPSYEEVMAN